MGRPPGSKNKPKIAAAPAEEQAPDIAQGHAAIGHNSHVGAIDRNALKSIIERLEALEADKAAIAEDMKDIYAEAKGAGFDVAALRAVVKFRKQDRDKADATQSAVDAYLHALGDLADLPLGKAAIEREFGGNAGTGVAQTQ